MHHSIDENGEKCGFAKNFGFLMMTHKVAL